MKTQLFLLITLISISLILAQNRCQSNCNSKCNTHRCKVTCYQECQETNCCDSCTTSNCCSSSCCSSSCCSSDCNNEDTEKETVIIKESNSSPSNSNFSISLNNVIHTLNKIHNPINVTTINENNIEILPAQSTLCCKVLIPWKNCTRGTDECGGDIKTICSDVYCKDNTTEVIDPDTLPMPRKNLYPESIPFSPEYPVYQQPVVIPEPYNAPILMPQPIPIPQPVPVPLPIPAPQPIIPYPQFIQTPCQYEMAPQPQYSPCASAYGNTFPTRF
ncbi:putative keratin-associated protein 4-16 [Onthophagus taurus]|uniref:putative keratin-associated protein 4-16 n=1 Tax=Onthophagus taurus TaxID=166361 RepID=UPI0039BE04D1